MHDEVGHSLREHWALEVPEPVSPKTISPAPWEECALGMKKGAPTICQTFSLKDGTEGPGTNLSLGGARQLPRGSDVSIYQAFSEATEILALTGRGVGRGTNEP